MMDVLAIELAPGPIRASEATDGIYVAHVHFESSPLQGTVQRLRQRLRIGQRECELDTAIATPAQAWEAQLFKSSLQP